MVYLQQNCLQHMGLDNYGLTFTFPDGITDHHLAGKAECEAMDGCNYVACPVTTTSGTGYCEFAQVCATQSSSNCAAYTLYKLTQDVVAFGGGGGGGHPRGNDPPGSGDFAVAVDCSSGACGSAGGGGRAANTNGAGLDGQGNGGGDGYEPPDRPGHRRHPVTKS